MNLFDKYLSYWPVIAASLVFILLGLWWRFYAARAMERSPKSIEWVRRYRTGGFPFRRKLMGSPKLHVWALLAVLLAAGVLAWGRLANMGMILSGRSGSLFSDFYGFLRLTLALVGAGAVYCLLNVLFGSPWTALPGALLFAASAARGHEGNSLLALSLLFLLLYLREDKPGFPAELLYLASVLSLSLAVAAQPALLWLAPCYLPVHWYKLDHQLRTRRLPGKKLGLTMAAALVTWIVAAALGSTLHPLLAEGAAVPLFSFSRFGPALRTLTRDAIHSFALPALNGVVDLMVDAPLLGFGLWGFCSAWILARKRRDARGYFVLGVLAGVLLVWLITWSFMPTLGLTLSAACILRDANLGRKRIPALTLTLLGVAWYIFIHTAAWALPLSAELQARLM